MHYIVDKPWERRIASDGVAGHLGRDGITHGWWWKVWEDWRRSVAAGEEMGSGELLSIMDRLVAKSLDSKGDRKQCEENKGKVLPISVPEHPCQISGAINGNMKGPAHAFANGDAEYKAKNFHENTVYGDLGKDELDFPILRKQAPAEDGG